MTQRLLYLTFALVFAALCALATGASAATVSTGDFQITNVGVTVQVPITLDVATLGMAGYQIDVTLGDPAVAEITSVTFPGFSFLSSVDGTAVSGRTYTLPAPSSTITIKGSDLGSMIANGATNVVLATVTIRAKAPGISSILATPDTQLGIQDRNGNPYTSDSISGSVRIDMPTVPGAAAAPTDTNGDRLYEDVNGNGRQDFADIVLYFNQMGWIAVAEPIPAFDYNSNGRIDFADVVLLFNNL